MLAADIKNRATYSLTLNVYNLLYLGSAQLLFMRKVGIHERVFPENISKFYRSQFEHLIVCDPFTRKPLLYQGTVSLGSS